MSFNYKDKIILSLATNACQKVSRKVVRRLQKMTTGMQSGSDSYLKNIWDEICAQVQYEQFMMWDEYLNIIWSIIYKEVEKLDNVLNQSIWLQTEQGYDWEYYYDEDDIESFNQEDTVPFLLEDIVEYILYDFVLVAAADWSNKRIEKYLEREHD